MAQNDPSANFKVLSALDAVTIASATTTTGLSIDTIGWRWATVIVQVGVVAGTTSGVSGIVEASSTTSGTFAAITGATFSAAALLAGATIRAARIDLTQLASDGSQRWIHVEFTTTGAAPSVPISACVILSEHDNSSRQSVTYDFAI